MSASPELLAWSSALLVATLALAQALRGGRRRSAINEAVHELRRPLQALALIGPDHPGGVGESSVRLAAAALDRLDREVNGGGRPERASEVVRCAELLRDSVCRWQVRALMEGGDLSLEWRGGEARVLGDERELAQALDNLIVNAIEHGGARVKVEGSCSRDRVLLCVADAGPPGRRAALRGDAFSLAVERFSGRRRRGHGLAVVRRIASDHGGRFVLERASAGSRAILELPSAARPSAG